MFMNMINAISKPKSVFLRIKDKGIQIFLYIILLTVIVSIPLFLKMIIEPSSLFVDPQGLSKNLYHLLDEGIEIKNNQLISNDNDIKFQVGTYLFVVGNEKVEEIGYVVVFEENHLVTYFSSGQGILVKVSSESYEKLGYKDLVFKSDNKSSVYNLIMNNFKNNGTLMTLKFFEEFLAILFDILFIILFLSLLALLSNRIPLNFGKHFKVNTYIATIYAISLLILNLFNLGNLSILSIFIVYIYHFRVYNSVRLIKTTRKDDTDE